MKLNDIELCRVAAFREGLQIIAAKEQEKGIEIDTLSKEGVKALQAYTVDRANEYAKRQFPDVSFPDETEREPLDAGRRFDDSEFYPGDESADLLGGSLALVR